MNAGSRVATWTFFLRFAIAAAVFQATASSVGAVAINTNDINVYNTFAVGATVQNFENLAGLTPLSLTSYTNALNASTSVPAAAQLSTTIPGLLFHSGGGSINNGVINPGTPTALLQLGGIVAGDAHSATNVVGPLAINTDLLDLDQFLEIAFVTPRDRVGVWLNPGLGNVLVTATDINGITESANGTAGNFVAIQHAAADIRNLSVVNTDQKGFTIDDLTYGSGTAAAPVPEPGTLTLLAAGALTALKLRKRRR